MQIGILIPAFNLKPWKYEFGAKLSKCFAELKAKYQLEPVIFFVDDGSTLPGTSLHDHFENFGQLLNCRVVVAKHQINRGQGAALNTALRIAKSDKFQCEYFVTMDADEQHDPEDIEVLLSQLLESNLNIVFGNRFGASDFYLKQIPLVRKTLLWMAIKFEKVVTGLDLSDAHNGFRVFDKKTAQALNISQDRMAHATEMKKIVFKNHLKYGESTVRISYHDDPTVRGQRNGNAINIIQELLREVVFK